MGGLENFHFAPAFGVSVDPEFPGDGDWGCDVYGFGRDGLVEDDFHSAWGTPTIIEVIPSEGDRWVGKYAAGGLGIASGLYATPDPFLLCVVVDGLAYMTDVRRPGEGSLVVHNQVSQVMAVEGASLLLLVRAFDIVALGIGGVAWRTGRIAVDDLFVVSATDGVIECTLDNLGGSDTITLEAATGRQLGGTRLDSFWPPDALA